jgi:4-hydroxy-3-polyprenylbenzoate decarboxylase
MSSSEDTIILGISGASGAVLGLDLLRMLASRPISIHVVVTDAARQVLAAEEQMTVSSAQDCLSAAGVGGPAAKVVWHDAHDLAAPISSGSFGVRKMVVCPCSMGALAAIACGLSRDLLERAADVTIKEGGNLVLVPRETPLSAIHLEHMLKLARLGVAVCPPMVAHYHKPKTLDDVVNHTLGKVLDLLGYEHTLFERWKGLK